MQFLSYVFFNPCPDKCISKWIQHWKRLEKNSVVRELLNGFQPFALIDSIDTLKHTKLDLLIMRGTIFWTLTSFLKNKTNSVVWVRERTIPTEEPQLVGEVSANFCGCHVVSMPDPYGRILGFLDRKWYEH
jgi:hypothetical protein